jgi:hypothetical protein
MTAHLAAGVLLLLSAVLVALPAWHFLAGHDDAVRARRRLRRTALREGQRQELDREALEEPYRKQRQPRRAPAGLWREVKP